MGSKSKPSAEGLGTFIGTATLAIDAAGRTNLPKEFRKVLAEEINDGQVVVTAANDGTLALYSISEWKRYVEYIEGLGRGPDVAKFRSLIYGMARQSTLDAQNRITLTQQQMKYAGIQGEVTFVGDGKRVRLWQPQRYTNEIETLTPEDKARHEHWF
ncbi:MAG TPA: hypothetical protein DCQ83_01780 [Fibrobacteres bacterium]|jgi:MraZ protein|nr:hypothetical protein [Fibrobacterota bacterium]